MQVSYIDDTPGVKVGEIRSKCRRLAQEHGLGMILLTTCSLFKETVDPVKTVSRKFLKSPVP